MKGKGAKNKCKCLKKSLYNFFSYFILLSFYNPKGGKVDLVLITSPKQGQLHHRKQTIYNTITHANRRKLNKGHKYNNLQITVECNQNILVQASKKSIYQLTKY